MPDTLPAERLANSLLPIVRIAGEDLRYTMDERRAHYGCPAVGVAVIDGGELAWSAGYGVFEADKPRAIDADTMFSGASISKPYAAVLALQLVERGVFDLDTNVNRYLKSWQLPENEFTRVSPVTLRWLLSHKAGTTIHGFGCYPHDKPMPSARDILDGPIEWVGGRMTNGVVVDKVPGGTTRYSGGGTTLVQQMLEDATGKPFEMLARENIFEPLGMKHSTFETPLPERYHATTAVGHEGGEVLPWKFAVVPALAAGGIYCSPADHARFMIACRDAYLGKGKLLGRKFAEEMMTQQGEGGEFGIGWEIFGKGPNRRFGHG